MDKAKRNGVIYWIVTLLVILPTALSGVVELFTSGPEQVAQSMRTLGYPLYIMKILGFAKIAGGLAICFSRWSRLKEWAYAGFTFDFLGATASHIFADDAARAPAPLACLVVLAISYVLWAREGRKAPLSAHSP